MGAALALSLCACDAAVVATPSPHTTDPTAALTAPPPTPALTAPPSPGAQAFPCEADPPTQTLIAYQDADDVWLYGVSTNERRRLTDDGDARSEHDVAFLTARCIVFAGSGTIEVLDLFGGGRRELAVEAAGAIGGLAVSPDGSSVLYLHIDYDVDATFRLKRASLGGGPQEVVYVFNPNIGRGGSSEDEVSIAWAPDGSAFVVANTHEYSDAHPEGGVYLFDATGTTIRKQWDGTHPRWSADGATIYYRGHAGGGDQRWRALDVRTLEAQPMGVRPGTNNLVVSPDGRWLAYDTSWFGDVPAGILLFESPPDVFAWNIETQVEQRLRRGALGPRWISADEVLVTDAGLPPEESWNSWASLGTVTGVDTNGNARAVEIPTSLYDVDVLLGGP